MQELARGWRTDPDTLPFLKDRARNDEHWDVRQAAVRELARGWRTDADTLPFLKDRTATTRMSTFARRRCRSWRGAGEPTRETLAFLEVKE